MRISNALRRSVLLSAASIIGLSSTPALSQALAGSIESPDIIVRNDINPNAPPPGGVLDSGINGVGQMTVRVNPTSTSMSVCTGTLINPRTVIFAAHCVNTRPAEAYGANGIAFGAHSGGTPIAFGFGADNLPAVRQWLGLDGGTAGATNLARALYAVEQVWYDPRSRAPASCTTATSCFLQADIAMATLDTPAFDIPTWALLFSPLDGPTHATITGYGNRGNANSTTIAIDWRRRAAENMISVLGSFNDRNQWIFGSGGIGNNLYMLSFSDPAGPGNYNPAAGNFDFGIFGDAALPREGTTAGGDSGGPLIVDQRYDVPVVAAVLSGGSRFFAAQAGHNYGTHDFFQPLHAYWDVIVANNPYVYAGNEGGVGNWEDPNHWVQLMDPAYMVDIGGVLVNTLPDTPAEGISGTGAKFGQICFLGDCTTLSQAAPTGTGTPVFVPGGPGSTMFVPNNIVANPAAGVKARYYDVTLAAAGTTRLGSAVTVDRMTLDGQTKLDIAAAGSLNVLGDYNQFQGWTNVDGSLASNRDMLVLSGLLSGSGTVIAPFVTVVGGIVAPGGGDTIGTLTVQGDLILASASAVFLDVQRGSGDQLVVTGNATNDGLLALNGGSVVFNKVTNGASPRHGDSFIIATAAGGVDGTFGNAYTFQGVLRPELVYGADSITAILRAGSLVEILDGGSATEIAFATALDNLRTGSYASLWNLYGSIDWMNGSQLSATFASLTPRILGDAGTLHDRQSKLLLTSVSDRLSLLASGRAQGLTMVGNLAAAFQARAQGVQSGKLGFGASNGAGVTVAKLPGRLTGFVSGGVDRTRSSYGGDELYASQGGWHMAMGLEMPLGDKGAFGTAAGIAEGESSPSGDHNRSRTTMAAAYASMPLGDGFYVGGLVAAESSRASLDRQSTDGSAMLRLTGATNATRYSAVAEAGFTTGIGNGLMLTPRAQLGYGHYTLGGFTEEGGETALRLSDVSVSRVEARLGAKLEGKTRIAGVAVMPQLTADYVSLLSGRKMGATVRFAVAPDEAIHLPLNTTGSGWAEFKGGVTFGDGPLTLGLSGQHATGGALTDQRAQADISFRF